MSSVSIDTAAAKGQNIIDWAGKHMLVLQDAMTKLAESGAVSGIRLGVALQLDAKTGYFIQALQQAGAVVSVYAPAGSSDHDVLATLHAADIPIAAEAIAFLQTKPQIVLDDGAHIIRQVSEAGITLRGASETSTLGMQVLHELQQSQGLTFNVFDLNSSSLKRLVENQFGAGQSSVMAFVDITNLQLAGRPVLVLGHGDMGRGVAQHARALGARVTIAETDPLQAVDAVYQGHHLGALDDELVRSEVVFCTTGTAAVLTAKHVDLMQDGVLLCIAGDTQALAMDYLAANAEVTTVRAGVQQYTLPNGKAVKVIAEGKALQHYAGEGSPIETMDVCLALQVQAIQALLAANEDAAPQILGIDAAVDRELASLVLRQHFGGR